jgi:hypothetical protein
MWKEEFVEGGKPDEDRKKEKETEESEEEK